MPPVREKDVLTEDPNGPLPEGGVVDGIGVEYLEGGGILVDDPMAPQPAPAEGEFYSNLAEFMSESELNTIGSDICEYVNVDIASREPWIRRFHQGLQLMGVLDDPTPTLDVQGASTVVHPLIGMAVAQFNARAIDEMMPPGGPVKCVVPANASPEILARRDRVEEFMNVQLTSLDEEYYDDTDQLTFTLPWAGSVFRKVYPDHLSGMNVSRMVDAKDFIAPYEGGKHLRSLPRYTHRYPESPNDVAKKIEIGEYRSIDLGEPNNYGGEDESYRSLIDKAEDRQPSTHDDDRRHTIYECHLDLDLGGFDQMVPNDGIARPYIVVVDRDSQQVLAIRRNWKDGDELFQKRVWFVHYRFMPGVGFYGFGFIHLIGGLARAATGALRALLDAALAANFQGGFKTKEGRRAGDVMLRFGVWQDVDSSFDDLNKAFFTPPFREPSTALFQLLGLLVDSGRAFASVTEANVGEAQNNAPVGTTLAIIEQGAKLFSAIHKRMHIALRRELKLLFQLNHEFLPDEYPYDVDGESRHILREDFAPGLDVTPVSDPNIFSSTQRIAQAQAIGERAAAAPDLYNRVEVETRILKALRIPDIEGILVQPGAPEPMDPITENSALMSGQAASVVEGQDHEAHLVVHLDGRQYAEAAGMDKEVLAGFDAHIRETFAALYREQMQLAIGVPIPMGQPMPPEIQNEIALRAAMAQQQVVPPLSMAEGQEADIGAEAESAAKIERADREAQAKIRRDDMIAAAKVRRDALSAKMEQRRKDAEAIAQQKRDDAAAEADKQRGDQGALDQAQRGED